MKKITLSLFLILLLNLVILNVGHSNSFEPPTFSMARTNKEHQNELHFILEEFLHKLYQKTSSIEGKRVPTLKSPEEILSALDHFDTYLNSLPEKLQNNTRIQKIYVECLKFLFVGSFGHEVDGSQAWYPGSKGSFQAEEAISSILSRKILDVNGKKEFIKFVNSFDFNSNDMRNSAGIPETVNDYGDEEFRKRVIKQIKANRARPQYKSFELIAKPQETLDDLIRIRNLTPGDLNVLHNLFQTSEKDFFSDSVKIHNSQTAEFPNYFGREKEMEEILHALSRTERGHIIITGKAGVGKTTLLKMLQDGFVRRDFRLGEGAPIILELPITDVVQGSIDNKIKLAQMVGKMLNRHIILYVDQAHVATPIVKDLMKNFLTETITQDNSLVHVVLATTSQEARKLKSDNSFSRRFIEVNVDELGEKDSIRLVKETCLDLWRNSHSVNRKGFKGISEEALKFAARYFKFENQHGANPTGIKEFLEGAIISQMRKDEISGEVKDFELSIDHMREYLKKKVGMKIVPGEENFDKKFDILFEKFSKEYSGNEGFKHSIKEELYSYFSSFEQDRMRAWVLFGPPGGGKSYGAEKIAEHFFGGAMLEIDGSDYKKGGSELNTLKGSPPGYVGSEEQRSILTKFFVDNPNGGIILIEEADALHQDVIQVLTNMITAKKFTDGLGQQYDTSRYVILMNSNIGQDLMIPKDSKNPLTWEQYKVRRNQLTEKIIVDGGKEIEVVKKGKLTEVFEKFVGEIVIKSNEHADTSRVSQEAQKQKRRYRAMYVLSPDEEELLAGAKVKLGKMLAQMELDYGVRFKLDAEVLELILDLKHHEFEKGYGYVQQQLEYKLFRFLKSNTNHNGKTIKVKVNEGFKLIDGKEYPHQTLELRIPEEKKQVYSLGVQLDTSENQWATSSEMQKKIQNFTKVMQVNVKGNYKQIQETRELLRLKSLDWNTRVVITQIGSSGNGKTEYFKAMSKALYDTEEALFTMSGLTDPHNLSDFFRPSSGISGHNKETKFEKWFLSRRQAGGGIILLDELLSFKGLTQHEIAKKITIINELYDMLDEGFIKIAGELEDARGFTIGITGNMFQELFSGINDTPEAEQLINRILKNTGSKEIVNGFEKVGIDAPKVARLGKIFINGPLSRDRTREVGILIIDKSIDQLLRSSGKKININIDENISNEITSRLSTVQLGMRKVKEGINDLIVTSLAGIMIDMPKVKNIKASLDEKGVIHWYGDGKEIIGEGVIEGKIEVIHWKPLEEASVTVKNVTPQFENLDVAEKTVLSKEEHLSTLIHEVKGHWQARVVLSGENPSQTISLIPGDGFLGYVRAKEQKEVPLSSLRTMLKDIVTLEAGHRAVFLEDIFATGGGTSSFRKEDEMPMDDLGKVNKRIDAILSNNLVSDVTEFSDEVEKQEFRSIIRNIGKNIADDVIDIGNRSGQFEEAYEYISKKHFAGEDILNDFVGKMDHSKILETSDEILNGLIDKIDSSKFGGNSDTIWITSLSKAIKKFKKEKQILSKFEKRILLDLFEKNYREVAKLTGINVKLKRLRLEMDTMLSPVSSFEKSLKEIAYLKMGNKNSSLILDPVIANITGKGSDQLPFNEIIDQKINKIVSNNLIGSISEQSNESHKERFKALIKSLGDHVTDEVSEIVNSSEPFNQFINDLNSKNLTSEEYLEQLMKGLDQLKQADRIDENWIFILADSIKKFKKESKGFDKFEKVILFEIFENNYKESIKKVVDDTKLRKLRLKMDSMLNSKGNLCIRSVNNLLKSLFIK